MADHETNGTAAEFDPFKVPHSSNHEGNYIQTSDELVRTKHLSHETTVKTLGSLCGAASVPVLFSRLLESTANIEFAIIFVAYCAIHTIGSGLTEFKRWAQWIAVAGACGGLLFPPISTLLSVYVLYLLLSPKGRMVFSEEYRKIVEATPYIHYQISKIVVAGLYLLLALLILVLIAVLFA